MTTPRASAVTDVFADRPLPAVLFPWSMVEGRSAIAGLTTRAVRTGRCTISSVDCSLVGFSGRPMIHRSEQLSVALRGAFRMRIDIEEQTLAGGNLCLIPAGASHHGVVVAPSRLFAVNAPDDGMENVWNEATPDRSSAYPPLGRLPRRIDGTPFGGRSQIDGAHLGSAFAHWYEVAPAEIAAGVTERRIVGERMRVTELRFGAGATWRGVAPGETVLAVLSGSLEADIAGTAGTLDVEALAVAPPGAECLFTALRDTAMLCVEIT